MTPKSYFYDVWTRADLFGGHHAYIANNAAAALDPAELLRAEWAMRVSALDLYVHELVSQRLLEIFQGARPTCSGYLKSRSATTRLRGFVSMDMAMSVMRHLTLKCGRSSHA